MDLENRFATANVWQIYGDLAIKSARAQQSRIEDIGPVRRSNNDNAFLRIKAIHLDEQRIARLFAFIVAAAQTMATAPAHGVDFINKDQARRILARLLEHITHAAGADADEHFHEVGTTDAEKCSV